MRWIGGGEAAQGGGASPSQMGRFETQWLAAPENLSALADLSGQWIDRGDGSRQHLASVLQEGRKSANIHVISGAIWGIPVKIENFTGD